jgi:hypothetical protein
MKEGLDLDLPFAQTRKCKKEMKYDGNARRKDSGIVQYNGLLPKRGQWTLSFGT